MRIPMQMSFGARYGHAYRFLIPMAHDSHVGTYRRNPSTMAPGRTLGRVSLPLPTLPSITRANTPFMLAVGLQVLLPREARYVALANSVLPLSKISFTGAAQERNRGIPADRLRLVIS